MGRRIFEGIRTPTTGESRRKKKPEKKKTFDELVLRDVTRSLMENLVVIRSLDNVKNKKKILERLRKMIEKEEERLE